LNVGGPLWTGRLFDASFCETIESEAERRSFKLSKRIRRMLALIRGEIEAPISYYVVDNLCDSLGLPVPSIKSVAEAVRREGFQVSFTHFNTRGIRTNASASEVKKILCTLAICK
jgi:tRNA (guanine26-N2/guanine27-N2)-dimethyltransferase